MAIKIPVIVIIYANCLTLYNPWCVTQYIYCIHTTCCIVSYTVCPTQHNIRSYSVMKYIYCVTQCPYCRHRENVWTFTGPEDKQAHEKKTNFTGPPKVLQDLCFLTFDPPWRQLATCCMLMAWNHSMLTSANVLNWWLKLNVTLIF